MTAWLLGIVGVVSLGVLIEIIMPEGEHSKYIKGIFSIIVVFVIVSPFPKLMTTDGVNDFFSNESVQIEMDENSYESIKTEYHNKINDDFDKILQSEGFGNIRYKIYFDDEYMYNIENITILSSDDLSTQELEKLQDLIEKYLGDVKIIRS